MTVVKVVIIIVINTRTSPVGQQISPRVDPTTTVAATVVKLAVFSQHDENHVRHRAPRYNGTNH